jgi:hypothetical protein
LTHDDTPADHSETVVRPLHHRNASLRGPQPGPRPQQHPQE